MERGRLTREVFLRIQARDDGAESYPLESLDAPTPRYLASPEVELIKSYMLELLPLFGKKNCILLILLCSLIQHAY